MQYEKANAELVVFGRSDVIITSPGGFWDSLEELDDHRLDHGGSGRPGGFPGRPGHRN